ncbi:hypothetical protein Tco_0798310 [Tanacetum coccineum]
MVADLEKTTGSVVIQQIIDRLSKSYLLCTTKSQRVGVLEADLTKTKKTYSSAYTKLILRVKKLEAQIKVGKSKRLSRFFLSDTKLLKKRRFSSKHGRKLSNEWVQDDKEFKKNARYGIRKKKKSYDEAETTRRLIG